MLYCDFVKSVRAGGLAQIGAKVLLTDLGNGAVLAQLIDSLVQSFAQGGGFIALAHRESNLGSIIGQSRNLDVRIGMLFQVVKIGYFGVQGGIHTAVQQQLNGLVQVVHAGGFSAIAFGQCCIGAGNGVGGGLAVQILKAVDAVIIAFTIMAVRM